LTSNLKYAFIIKAIFKICLREKEGMEMKSIWRNILFDFYCLGCLTILFLAVLGHDRFLLALIYAGLTIVYGIILVAAMWIKRVAVGGTIKIVMLCLRCNDCIPLVSSNHAPEYEGKKEMSVDDYADFIKSHSGHKLRYLNIILGPWNKKNISWNEPIKNELFLATGKWGLFLINRARTSIWQPMRYQAFPVWHLKAIVCWFKWIFT